jgi:hypothetical protein
MLLLRMAISWKSCGKSVIAFRRDRPLRKRWVPFAVPAGAFTVGLKRPNLGGILCAVAALGLTLWSLQEERLAREEDRINRAWSLVAAAKVDGAGNIGQIDALETLATRRTDLSRIKLRGAYLEKIHLAGAQLGGADLSHAILALADLSGSKLDGASFVSSLLSIANLAYADLSRADFTNADLSKRQTSLCNADLCQFRWRQLTLPLCDAHDPGKTRQGCPLRTILFGRPMG